MPGPSQVLLLAGAGAMLVVPHPSTLDSKEERHRVKKRISWMSGCKSIVLLETGAGSALLISRPRLNLSVKIHLERKKIVHGGRIPELLELSGNKSRSCSGRAEQQRDLGWGLPLFPWILGGWEAWLDVLLLLFIVALCSFVLRPLWSRELRQELWMSPHQVLDPSPRRIYLSTLFLMP